MQTTGMMRFAELAKVPLENETEINRKRKWSQLSRNEPDLASESERRKNKEEALRPRSRNSQADDQSLDYQKQVGLMSTARMIRASELPAKRTATTTTANEVGDGYREEKRRVIEMTYRLKKDHEKVIYNKNCEIKALKDQLKEQEVDSANIHKQNDESDRTPTMKRTTSISVNEDEDGGRETNEMIEMKNRLNKEKVICQKNCEIKVLKDQLKVLNQEKTEMKRYYESEKSAVTEQITGELTGEFEERASKMMRENRRQLHEQQWESRKQLHEQRRDYDLKILKLFREKEQIALGYRRQPLHCQYFKDRINQFETIQQCISWKMDLHQIIKEIDQKKVKHVFTFQSVR
jgi:hypothetical protein